MRESTSGQMATITATYRFREDHVIIEGEDEVLGGAKTIILRQLREP